MVFGNGECLRLIVIKYNYKTSIRHMNYISIPYFNSFTTNYNISKIMHCALSDCSDSESNF